VNKGLEVVPTGSWTREIVTKAQQLYQADLDDDGTLNSWLNSRNEIISFPHQRGRDRIWVESPSNTGLTTLAILYGQGNFVDTVAYGVNGGEDSDCNPATAGGLIGMMKGADVILTEMTAAGLDVSVLPQTYYNSSTVVGLPKSDWTIDEVLGIMQASAEKQILDGGGAISGSGATKQYTIGDAGTGLDLVNTGNVSDPDTGPGGLVGQVLDLGGQVYVVVTRNGVVITDDNTNDRRDQNRLIDGVVDLTNNGVLPFDTYNGSTDARTDGYELHFDRNVLFDKLVLHEGDIRPSGGGGGLSGDPTDPSYEPYGGYFTDLIVEVFRNGDWVEVDGLSLSEALDPYAYFQSIELSFAPITGEAIRMVGTAGGQQPYTSLTEFVAMSEPVTGDLDHDGDVDIFDWAIFQPNYGSSGMTYDDGDLDGDGDVDIFDWAIFQPMYGYDTNSPVPEPVTGALLGAGLAGWRTARTCQYRPCATPWTATTRRCRPCAARPARPAWTWPR